MTAAWRRWMPLWAVAAAAASGCSGGGGDVGALAGDWTGSFDVEGGPYTATGSFAFDKDEELLSGEIVVGDADPPNTYAIRRSEELSGVLYLDLTDVEDGTRGLHLDGEIKAKKFTGTATLNYTCPAGTCGYQGPFSLDKGEGAPPPTSSPAGT